MAKHLYSLDDCDNLNISEVKKLYREYVNPSLEGVFSSFSISDELIAHAEGVWMYAKSGKKILDSTGGIGVLNTGHNHPRILKARIRYQEMRKMEVHKTLFSPYLAALSHNIGQLLPDDLRYSYFCNSGAEAVEGALKVAYKFHGGKRKYVLHSDISFHGKLLGAGSITRSKEIYFKYQSVLNSDEFEYNSLESVSRKIKELRKENGESDVYALIVEPFSASTLRNCSNEFLEAVRELCTREGIILIFDEVFSGWFKTGKLFYFFNSKAIPDILTTSKSLGGGKSSISAYISRKHVMLGAYGNLRDATLHNTTYNGFGEECITALEAINLMVEENYEGKCLEIEKITVERLEKLKGKYPELIAGYSGSGALFGIFFKENAGILGDLLSRLPVSVLKDERFLPKLVTASFAERLFTEHSIYCLFTNNHYVALVFSPALVINAEEVNYFFDSLDNVLSQGLWKAVFHFAKRKFSATNFSALRTS